MARSETRPGVLKTYTHLVSARRADGARAAAIDRVKGLLSFSERHLSLEGAGVFAVDSDLQVIHWSAVMESLLGLAADDALGRDANDVFPEGTSVHLKKALAGENEIVRGASHAPPDRGAREAFFDAYYSPLTDEHNAIVGAMGVLRDVTGQKLAEQQQRETENRFRTMADAAPVLLWMAGPDALCTFFNQTWLDFTGRTLREEWGLGWAEGIHYEDFQRCMDSYLAAFSSRNIVEMEYRLRRHDGQYRWVLDRGTPRFLPDGTFAGYIGSCVDITDKKQVEAELRKAVRDRDDFLSIASHELRTPLTTLQLEVENMQRSLSKRAHGGSSPAKISRSVEATAAQANRLIRLVEELLDMSRLAAGQLRLSLKNVDLGELVKEVVQKFSASVESAECPVELELESRVIGCWDRHRIERVVNNLLSNALKYGAGKPVRIGVARDETDAVLVVTDAGIGIAKEDHKRIFERFERAVSTTNYGGFGLGLWITQEITAAHGGSIQVGSSLGAGATFTVRLPLRRPQG